MDNGLQSLSFSMQANKGVYALLLGSGISYSASIPTGWGILQILCHKMSILDGEDNKDGIEWYREKYGKEPLYDEVIEMLARTSTERLGLLEEFFVPTEDEMQDKKKIPTVAHHSIAKLVKAGFIKVIITTNFDRLLEQALDELNVQYQTLYHDTDIEGMKPLVHSECTILKIHGDYRDTRFKNITDELRSYSSSVTSLLKEVFNDYGMIVSGWSSEWDTALRDTIKSVLGRRYSWYWHSFTAEVNEKAQELINFRDASLIIDNGGADHLFSELAENVVSISEMKKENPETIQIKNNRLKRFLRNNDEIGIRDLITDETKALVTFTNSIDVTKDISIDLLKQHVIEIKEKSKPLISLMFILCSFMESTTQKNLVIETIERLTSIKNTDGKAYLLNLKQLPLQYVFYSVGISLTKNKDFEFLNEFFTKPKIREKFNKDNDLLKYTSPYRGLRETFDYMYKERRFHLPLEEDLYPYLLEVTTENGLLFDEEEFTLYYDCFEFLRCIKVQYLNRNDYVSGRFGYKVNQEELLQFIREGFLNNSDWDVLELTERSPEEFKRALNQLEETLNSQMHFNVSRLVEAYSIEK